MTNKYDVIWTKQFKKDYKAAKRQRKDITPLLGVIEKLANDTPLPPRHKDHALSGDWKGYRECHISPDWLLIYILEGDVLVLTLYRAGSHAEIFGK
ncbi:MAG: type II toxin-antitoxin system YafQ family toxin [bacterium]|nr:type II toxin-antitoxin system YafQ family toxin [bacterium]